MRFPGRVSKVIFVADGNQAQRNPGRAVAAQLMGREQRARHRDKRRRLAGTIYHAGAVAGDRARLLRYQERAEDGTSVMEQLPFRNVLLGYLISSRGKHAKT